MHFLSLQVAKLPFSSLGQQRKQLCDWEACRRKHPCSIGEVLRVEIASVSLGYLGKQGKQLCDWEACRRKSPCSIGEVLGVLM